MSERREYGNLILSPSPHIHSGENILWVTLTYLLALLPVVLMSFFDYGLQSARVLCLSMGSAVAFEWLIQLLFGKEVTVHDGSALLTGLIFGLLMPAGAPWWLVLTGTFVSILVGKQIFGGNGGYPFNPALIGWAAVRISWYGYMDYNLGYLNFSLPFPMEYPLTLLKNSGMSGVKGFSEMNLFLGNQVGGLGTVYIYLLLIGGLMLLLRGVVSWHIPVSFIGGVLLTSLIFYLVNAEKYGDPLFHLLTGSVVFGAFFLATDHSTSPVNGLAMIFYGLGCGIFTMLFRAWSVYPDGVVFAILFMNILNPLLDRIRPNVPGWVPPLQEVKE